MACLFRLFVASGLASAQIPDCNRCGRFPRMCDDVAHCIQSCGTHQTFSQHCAKLRSFEVDGVPLERRTLSSQQVEEPPLARATRENAEEPSLPDMRTAVQKMMGPGGSGPRRDEI
mmetsp:Transcript_50787/g.94968  ORF Transcript_50787/g.94968 Transcript_50787/m.94968 type:complete len:116 (-) Transcript_50787:191-538(-)